MKLILGIGEPLMGRLLLYDALAMRFRELKLRRNPECPVCGDHPTITKLIDYQQFCGIPQHEPAPCTGSQDGEISVDRSESTSSIAATISCCSMCASRTNIRSPRFRARS